MKNILLLLTLSITLAAKAEDKAFVGESEASAVVISGNSNNETYSVKSKNTYKVTELDLLTGFGKYIRTVSGGAENAKAWEAGLRYDRVLLKDLWNVFVQHKAEHDPYNGVFIQRDSSDIGVKYTITKTDDLNWFSELGYRYSDTYLDTALPREKASFARVYTEAAYKISPTTATKLWLEYLPNLKKADESQANAEFSVSVTMTDVFSLKTAYLYNRNEAVLAPGKKDTTTWTTALVAKY